MRLTSWRISSRNKPLRIDWCQLMDPIITKNVIIHHSFYSSDFLWINYVECFVKKITRYVK
jgi:hypothetical protein